MTSVLQSLRRLNGLGGHGVTEPYGGGAGASLRLLYLEEAPFIHINDGDPAIHDFWWSATYRTPAFRERLAATPISVAEWERQREIYSTKGRRSRLDRGFAAFYLNRANRSGIIPNGSVIGGLEQTGQWKVDARFNKVELDARIEKLGSYRSRITVSNLDGLDVVEAWEPESSFLFVDPPYFHKGETLYLNVLDPDYHQALAKRLGERRDSAWALTYDDCPEVRAMYAKWASIRPFSLRYSASERRKGLEVLITPRWMKLPQDQTSLAIGW